MRSCCALSFEGLEKLLPALPGGAPRDRLEKLLAGFSHSPLTGIHLWFDREITPLNHAVLLDTTVQWLYNTSRIQPERQSMRSGHLIELVVSASKSLVPMERQAIIDLAMRELALFFPAMREARLLKAAVVKEVRATYSIVPGLDTLRPAAESGWPGLDACRRLDRHGVALHYGERCSQRISGGRGRQPQVRRCEALSRGGSAQAGADAFATVGAAGCCRAMASLN